MLRGRAAIDAGQWGNLYISNACHFPSNKIALYLSLRHLLKPARVGTAYRLILLQGVSDIEITRFPPGQALEKRITRTKR